jgi:hypothetical protein
MKFTIKNSKYVQGIFKPTHIEKYKGHDLPRYLSSWELKLFRWCDTNPNVLEWGSESIVISYLNPVDNKPHRYIVDAVIKLKTSEGIKKFLVEVKPFKQTIKPYTTPGKHKKTLLYEQLTYIQNMAKWEAAKKWCKKRGFEFTVLTEKELRK